MGLKARNTIMVGKSFQLSGDCWCQVHDTTIHLSFFVSSSCHYVPPLPEFLFRVTPARVSKGCPAAFWHFPPAKAPTCATTNGCSELMYCTQKNSVSPPQSIQSVLIKCFSEVQGLSVCVRVCVWQRENLQHWRNTCICIHTSTG